MVEDALLPGQRIDDFEIIDTLGRGAFGAVYLARQLSLDRQVALKVSAAHGSEGRNLARLEHAHIVQVFSEATDSSGQRRLLCMQYVPGPSLEAILRAMPDRRRIPPSGAVFLATIDQLTTHPATLDPADLPNRALLERADWVETVCWIGGRLAEALNHAHRHGVLHRDVKPSNILVSQYGRPMLVDFNLAFRSLAEGGEQLFGGSLPYMAPEHLDAFNPFVDAGPEVVREPADLFGLGVVLFEMLAGHAPFPSPPEKGSVGEVLLILAATRRHHPPDFPRSWSPPLTETIARCLAADPAQRPASAYELASALDGCRQLHTAQRSIPEHTVFRRSLARHPFRWLIAVGLLPHAAGSVVNIAYNQTRIVNHLSDAQQAAFLHLAVVYNLLAYPLLIALALHVVLPVYRVQQRLLSTSAPAPRGIESARHLTLSWPGWAAALACLGWLPGALVFPLGLNLLAGPVGWLEQAHLGLSFTISGVIALTYGCLGVQCVVLNGLYARLWGDGRDFPRRAAAELTPVRRRLPWLQASAGAIPLVGALLLVGIGPQQFTPAEYQTFRILVAGLIALGMLGFQLSLVATAMLARTLTAFAPHPGPEIP
jgi:serine/threonine protein kinase